MSEYIVCMPNDMPYEIKAELNAWYVNSEPIVRCRDCSSCYQDEGFWRCGKAGFSIGFVIDDKPPRGFCAWGKRRLTWRELENSDQYAAAAHAFDTTNHNVCSERGE